LEFTKKTESSSSTIFKLPFAKKIETKWISSKAGCKFLIKLKILVGIRTRATPVHSLVFKHLILKKTTFCETKFQIFLTENNVYQNVIKPNKRQGFHAGSKNVERFKFFFILLKIIILYTNIKKWFKNQPYQLQKASRNNKVS